MAAMAKKANKIIVFSFLGLVALVAVIAVSTQSSAEDKLKDGLRAIQPSLATEDAPQRARAVCTTGVTVDHVAGAFFVDAGTAAKLTVPISSFCNG
jgi:hypothetical protein